MKRCHRCGRRIWPWNYGAKDGENNVYCRECSTFILLDALQDLEGR